MIVKPNNTSWKPSTSASGQYVAFQSSASNLVPNDTNTCAGYSNPGQCPDVFVYDRVTSHIDRVSLSSSGIQANGASSEDSSPSMSADGRYVAFESNADNLVSSDTNSVADIFVRDRQTGQTDRVSVASDGTQANGKSVAPSLSADGRYIAFASAANNLVANDTAVCSVFPCYDVFVHDRQTGQTTRVSVSSIGEQANNTAGSPSISADGRYIVFDSWASNLVSGDTQECIVGSIRNCSDIFVRDRQTGQTTRVSIASDGTQGNDLSNNASISSDGRYVVFSSFANNLVPNDTNGQSYVDVFVHDRQANQTTRVSISSAGVQANAYSNNASITADGRYVVFTSAASNLVDGDTNNARDVFVHDRQTSETTRITVNSSGLQGNGNAVWSSISTDGRYVAFDSSATNLVSGDTNGFSDVFLLDRGADYSTTQIKVYDDFHQPISGAKIYQNDNEIGYTDATGALSITGLQGGDTVAATKMITEVPSAKLAHGFPGWAYRVYNTSVPIDDAGNPLLTQVNTPGVTQVLTVSKNNTLVGFNIVASVEWNASASYLSDLRQGFADASTYLYDVTDGQVLFEQVTIYNNQKYWSSAEYQVFADNTLRPETTGRVFVGRYWKEYLGYWNQPSGYRTLTHEFGHYGFDLRDSYKDAKGYEIASCTSSAIQTNTLDATNATMMDWQFNATELSMRGVPGLWSPDCELTLQMAVHHESDWETVEKRFRDNTFPPRYYIRTPDGRGSPPGAVVPGPTSIPVIGWSQSTVGNNPATGTCSSDPVLKLVDPTLSSCHQSESMAFEAKQTTDVSRPDQ